MTSLFTKIIISKVLLRKFVYRFIIYIYSYLFIDYGTTHNSQDATFNQAKKGVYMELRYALCILKEIYYMEAKIIIYCSLKYLYVAKITVLQTKMLRKNI